MHFETSAWPMDVFAYPSRVGCIQAAAIQVIGIDTGRDTSYRERCDDLIATSSGEGACVDPGFEDRSLKQKSVARE